jgi:hypothetical protein
MTQQLTMQYPAAVRSRRSGLRRARRVGETLRERYAQLLRDRGPLSDHDAAAALGVLSTTVGARRSELMAARPGCIESAGRQAQPYGVSRTVWRWVVAADGLQEGA